MPEVVHADALDITLFCSPAALRLRIKYESFRLWSLHNRDIAKEKMEDISYTYFWSPRHEVPWQGFSEHKFDPILLNVLLLGRT